MSARRRWWIAAMAVGLGVAGLGVPSAGGQGKAKPVLSQAFFTTPAHGDLRGVVAAVQPGARMRARTLVSLHEIAEGRYRIAAVNRPCSVDLNGDAVDAAIVWEIEDFAIGAGGAGTYATQTVPLERRLRQARSVRVYEREQEADFRQVGCSRSYVFIGGGAATGAIVG